MVEQVYSYEVVDGNDDGRTAEVVIFHYQKKKKLFLATSFGND